ncbi:MAG: helix-turn-helix domain-containing protein [Clostridiales bacterium]|nr:helix-turn-helix domain-containing protein [Clostridiales bacterium]
MYPVLDKRMTGRRIRRLMDARGISVKDVQQYLGLACVQSVYHWLDGSSMPTLDNIYALSELLQEPVDAMLCGNRRFKKPESLRPFGAYGGRAESYYRLIQNTPGLSSGIRIVFFPQAELEAQ